MQQFLINLSELQTLINQTTDANRILITVDTPTNGNGNGKTKATPTIKVRAVNFLNGGLVDSATTESTTMALSLQTSDSGEITGCPYPPGC